MSAIAINDAAYETVEGFVYELRTTRKSVVEKMIRFADDHRESFVGDMF